MWASIVDDNSVALSAALDALEHQIKEFRSTFESHDSAATHEFLARGVDWFDGTPSNPLS